MRFASIVGARPQFIKLAPVSRALRQCHQEVIIHTGQHYDYGMSQLFFDELALPDPDYHLDAGSGLHGEQTARMLAAIEQALLQVRPDQVIVFGDTNSTLAGALAAAKLHIPVAHVEAGLRSFNRAMPEEINRVVADHLSKRLFCPTEAARRHLASEGISQGVQVVGDVMYDLLLQVQQRLHDRAESFLRTAGVAPQSYVLVTVHRAANTDDPRRMRAIAYALNRLEMPVIFPAHPRTRVSLQRNNITLNRHIHVIEPVSYLAMLALEQAADCILTDSGGVQKEAFLLQVPCVTLRTETEWPETLEGGWNVLLGDAGEAGSYWQAMRDAINRPRPVPAPHNPFGKGNAALRIVRSYDAVCSA